MTNDAQVHQKIIGEALQENERIKLEDELNDLQIQQSYEAQEAAHKEMQNKLDRCGVLAELRSTFAPNAESMGKEEMRRYLLLENLVIDAAIQASNFTDLQSVDRLNERNKNRRALAAINKQIVALQELTDFAKEYPEYARTAGFIIFPQKKNNKLNLMVINQL